MDTSYALAKNIVQTKYEDLPAEVIEVTKGSILDTYGVTLAASTLGEQGVTEIIELVKQGGGREESTIFGFGGKTVSWMAAFANGAMSHQLDYDDTFDARLVHPGAATIPAASAIAERRGNVTGKEFITAVALGCDVICRLALPLTRNPVDYRWFRTATLGKFGATAAAGKLLGLNETQIVDAFGIALHQIALTQESTHTPGSYLRAIRDAFVAHTGVMSALLAEKGIKGDKNSLDGKYGLYNLYWRGDSDPASVTANLGKRFEGVDVSFKPWPCCRQTHTFIDATLSLVKEYDIVPKDVDELVASGGKMAESLCTPPERRNPKTSIDAKFSLPFVIGVAIARRNILLEDFTPKGRNNPVALEIAQKVTYRFDERFARAGAEVGFIEIKTRGGRKYSREVAFAYGHPQNPVSKGDLVAKFIDCACYSVGKISQDSIDMMVHKLNSLEEVKDVGEVIELLGATGIHSGP